MRWSGAIDGKLLVSSISLNDPLQQASPKPARARAAARQALLEPQAPSSPRQAPLAPLPSKRASPKPVRTRQSEWRAAPFSAARTATRRPPSDTHLAVQWAASGQRRQICSRRARSGSSQRLQASSQRRQASSQRRAQASSQRRQASSQRRPLAALSLSRSLSLQAPEFGWGPCAIRFEMPGTSLAAHLRQRHRLCNAASGAIAMRGRFVQGAALCECVVLARRVLSAVAVSRGELSANVRSAIVFFEWAAGRCSNSMRPYRVVGPGVCNALWTAHMLENNEMAECTMRSPINIGRSSKISSPYTIVILLRILHGIEHA